MSDSSTPSNSAVGEGSSPVSNTDVEQDPASVECSSAPVEQSVSSSVSEARSSTDCLDDDGEDLPSGDASSPSSSYQLKNPRRVSRTFKLPAVLVDELSAYADSHDLTATAVVRAALEAYLRPEEQPISKSDLVSLFSEFERRIEAVRVEAVSVLPSPDPVPPVSKKRGFFRRLFGG